MASLSKFVPKIIRGFVQCACVTYCVYEYVGDIVVVSVLIARCKIEYFDSFSTTPLDLTLEVPRYRGSFADLSFSSFSSG